MLNIVTGAFSYTGKYITRALLKKGDGVKTLTNHPGRPDPFGGSITAHPYSFDEPERIARFMEGADVFYNTYWVRFNYGGVTFERAVENSRTLIEAARKAGVRRIVHVSITNPSPDAMTEYFRGKAAVEKMVMESGLSWAIVRPTIVFGEEDILINNIAWLLRRLPVFFVFGDGDYPVQPVFVGDLAGLCVRLGAGEENIVCDAVGPETYSFIELVTLIRDSVGSGAWIARTAPKTALLAASILNRAVGDIMVSEDEVKELMNGLLVSKDPPLCQTRLGEWLREHAGSLGRTYASEIERHFR